MAFKIDIMTLFPEMCETVLNEIIIGRARKAGKVELHCTNIRDFSENKHHKVDDMPYGGGMGMVMAAAPFIGGGLRKIRIQTVPMPSILRG